MSEARAELRRVLTQTVIFGDGSQLTVAIDTAKSDQPSVAMAAYYRYLMDAIDEIDEEIGGPKSHDLVGQTMATARPVVVVHEP